MRSRRALLYVPADDERKINKAASLPVDCVILDLEDGVAPGRKDAARESAVRALQRMDFGNAERLVRINPVDRQPGLQDLEAILPARPDGILLPKIDSADTVHRVSETIARMEKKRGWPAGGIALIVIAETARAILRLETICSAEERVQAVIFGAEDLAADIGAVRSAGGMEVFTARSLVVLNAAAAGIQALDVVNVNYRDLEALYADARQAAGMGFAGKQIIHPAQIDPVQRAFTPSEDEVRQAQELIRAFEASVANGKGAFGLDGRMVDMPVIRRAENVLSRAASAGRRDR